MLSDDIVVRAINCEKMAAWALGEIEDPRALDALRRAAGDRHGEVRRAIANAIRELRGRS